LKVTLHGLLIRLSAGCRKLEAVCLTQLQRMHRAFHRQRIRNKPHPRFCCQATSEAIYYCITPEILSAAFSHYPTNRRHAGIYLLILDRPPEPFYNNIFAPAAFAIHADQDSISLDIFLNPIFIL